MAMRISITEDAFPDEEGDEISFFEHGGIVIACFRESELNGEQFGEGACHLLAAADLVLQPWKG